jgi:copper chaperone
METKTFSVPGMHCMHCEDAVTQELTAVDGVSAVEVDLETKRVTVTGTALDRDRLVAAIDEAGYDATDVAA